MDVCGDFNSNADRRVSVHAYSVGVQIKQGGKDFSLSLPPCFT